MATSGEWCARVVPDAERSGVIAAHHQSKVESSQGVSPARGGGYKVKESALSQVRADDCFLLRVHPTLWERRGART